MQQQNKKSFGLAPLNNNTNNNHFGEGHKCDNKSIQQVQQNYQQNTHLSVAKKDVHQIG